jgi:hypothetical protein
MDDSPQGRMLAVLWTEIFPIHHLEAYFSCLPFGILTKAAVNRILFLFTKAFAF